MTIVVKNKTVKNQYIHKEPEEERKVCLCHCHLHKEVPVVCVQKCSHCQDNKTDGSKEEGTWKNRLRYELALHAASVQAGREDPKRAIEIFEEIISQVRDQARREVAEEIIDLIERWEEEDPTAIIEEIKATYLSKEGERNV